jgi:hypothetical protein
MKETFVMMEKIFSLILVLVLLCDYIVCQNPYYSIATKSEFYKYKFVYHILH